METNGFDLRSFSGREPRRCFSVYSCFDRMANSTWGGHLSVRHVRPAHGRATMRRHRSRRVHVADERGALTRCALDRKSAIIRSFWTPCSHRLFETALCVQSWVMLNVVRTIHSHQQSHCKTVATRRRRVWTEQMRSTGTFLPLEQLY